MMKKLALAVAGAIALATMFTSVGADARPDRVGHPGFHRAGGHRGGFHVGGGFHGGGFHRGGRHFGPHRGFGRGPVFGHRRFAGPGFARRGFYARPFGWRGPRRVFVGGYGRPYPFYARPRVAYGFGPGCSTRRSVGFAPGGWRKIVTVRTCYVR